MFLKDLIRVPNKDYDYCRVYYSPKDNREYHRYHDSYTGFYLENEDVVKVEFEGTLEEIYGGILC